MMTTRKAQELYATNGKRLAHCRNQNKVPLRELEASTGVDASCIHRFEHNKPISMLHYIKLMDWLTHHERLY